MVQSLETTIRPNKAISQVSGKNCSKKFQERGGNGYREARRVNKRLTKAEELPAQLPDRSCRINSDRDPGVDWISEELDTGGSGKRAS
ncbi:unnamed protein product [Linum trigynum]|uniref:Uncharacterized protein n=1 Tax=Linum trigynum TaxID=586398 RepID=A0AAV2G3W6_9ROSI